MPLIYNPHIQALDANGDAYDGAKMYVYDAGTTDLRTTYSDSALSVPNANPLIADSAGIFGAMYFAVSDTDIKLKVDTSADVNIPALNQDNVPVSDLNQADIGLILYPTTGAETAASITPTNLNRWPHIYDVRRVGIVPNSAGASTANTTAIVTLLDPANTGPTGTFLFPNTTGADIYHFDSFVEIRDGCVLDLCGSKLKFTKAAYAGADDTLGFLMAIRDVTIQNGEIEVDYDGSAGTNAGMIFRLGSRIGWAFGSDTDGVEDEDLSVSMGNMTLRNLRLTSNNPGSFAVTLLGGTDNCLFENIVLEGQAALKWGLYYEFGFHHWEATAANVISSHAHNLTYRNITINDMDKTAGAGIALIGANSATVDGLYCDSGFVGFGARPGEAIYYNVAPDDAAGATQATIVLRDIVANDMVNTGVSMDGSEDTSAGGGYLAAEGLTETEETDRIQYSLDGFNVESDGFGVFLSAPGVVKNGKITGTCASGGLVIADDCVQFTVSNVSAVDGGNAGLRATFAGIWATPRLKNGTISNCVFSGNTTNGMSFAQTQSVVIENCRIGYNTLYDAAAETTQINAVSADATAKGIICRGNFVTLKVAGGGSAYVLAGTSNRGCNIEDPKGDVTASGGWAYYGVPRFTAANIIDRLHSINTDEKHVGRKVWDTTNKRMLVAAGAVNTDDWELVDGTVQITPV